MTKHRASAPIAYLTLWIVLTMGLGRTQATDDPNLPRVRADMKLELYCEEPEIATPVALDIDARGRVWVIESNTHFQTPDYPRHVTDRILILTGRNEDGTVTKVETFTDGLTHSMGLAHHAPGQVLLATRSDVLMLQDTDGNDRADAKTYLARLESKGKYPHNGLTGFATGPLGFVYFAIGENETQNYRLVGTDGQVLSGGPEGGSVFRMRPDGSELQHWAVGFWNTFHLAFDGFGRLFAVDNDPDSRPPCRLLHIVRGGDYGYRRWLGRKGLHPFTAWNGEIRGTLPMVSGTGEAPSGLVTYEHTALPADVRGLLLVTSWGDHRIETHRLESRGASWRSVPTPLVTGGEEFRPVGIAVAPDGSIYFSDWVKRDYPVHGRGRIWRLSAKDESAQSQLVPRQIDAARSVADFDALLSDPVRRVREAAIVRLALDENGETMASEIVQKSESTRSRYGALVTLTRRDALTESVIKSASNDPAAIVRAALCRFLAERPSRRGIEVAAALLHDREPGVQAEAARSLAWLFGSALVTPPAQPEAASEKTLTIVEKLRALIVEEDPFLAAAARDALATLASTKKLLDMTTDAPPEHVESFLLALRRKGSPEAQALLGDFLKHPVPAVRRAALHWVGVENLTQFQSQLEGSLTHGIVTRDVVDAYLAAAGLLAGIGPAARDEIGRDAFLNGIVVDTARPTPLRALALRCLAPTHESLNDAFFAKLLERDVPQDLRREAVRSLRESPLPGAAELLGKIAFDNEEPLALRREAVIGLARYLPETHDALKGFRRDLADVLRREAERALRLAAAQPNTQPPSQARKEKAHSGGDPAEGEILFHYAVGLRCASCHTIGGRGGAAGPDLSNAGQRPREKIVESILEPSREIAPQFAPWVVVTKDGATQSGIILSEDTHGVLHLGIADGTVTQIRRDQIASQEPSKTSIMPANSTAVLTDDELQDLVAFLASLR